MIKLIEKGYAEALRSARSLVLYRNIISDPVCRALLRFLESVTGNEPADEIISVYSELFFLLSQQVELVKGSITGDAWQDHLLELLLYDDNAFSRGASLYSLEKLGSSLQDAASGDLARLQTLFRIDGISAREALLLKVGENCIPYGGLPLWKDLATITSTGIYTKNSPGRELKALLLNSSDWRMCLEKVACYYREAGSGLFGRYRAFRWSGAVGRMKGIDEPDPVRLEELVGYQDQRQEVVGNTEKLLAGLPANNLLLYGDRGTGKSSTVKALLNHYGEQGLRLIEVPKSNLGDFPEIVSLLKLKAQKFIIFVDDLSFEESEFEYKEFKAVLEGGLASRPSNVLIYATSNRRHLVRERFSDREQSGGQEDEIHGNDTVQEKLSLADRFGVTIFFTTPNRALYLKIVRGIAEYRRLEIETGELERRALLWASWHNGWSGRTARQFVDHISGEMLSRPEKS
jgi:predicted AAA+ superfamily ATPase